MGANHLPYQLRLLALATAKSVWSKQLFLEICAELQVHPDDVDGFKTNALTIPQLRQIGAIK